MVKQGRSSPPKNAPYKIIKVVADAGLPSAHKKPQSNVKALISNLSGVSKDAAHSTNAAQEKNSNDESQSKSIYIRGLPTNTTKNELQTVVKLFGPVHSRGIQLKNYEDGFCCGCVHFQDAISAQNVVKTHHIIVKGREAYIQFKRINHDGS
ncbi:hypothetical protein K7X08_021260 [Anisodus acutangulus]|uniref:RRM domain-containing protein n=1 Tax=Anisodus acutangulus TaxID=402998 RepID=A0A9Q1M334_9SOLA|nr:hypothetical protein K7X08_021260 [Anisodus acutangulus]